jgi:hypothetical protein
LASSSLPPRCQLLIELCQVFPVIFSFVFRTRLQIARQQQFNFSARPRSTTRAFVPSKFTISRSLHHISSYCGLGHSTRFPSSSHPNPSYLHIRSFCFLLSLIHFAILPSAQPEEKLAACHGPRLVCTYLARYLRTEADTSTTRRHQKGKRGGKYRKIPKGPKRKGNMAPITGLFALLSILALASGQAPAALDACAVSTHSPATLMTVWC